MSMGKPRKPKNSRYPEGFYPPDERNGCRMIHPLSGKPMALKTRNIQEGLELYRQIKEHFSEQKQNIEVKQFAGHHGPLVKVLSEEYRTQHLPKAISKRGATKGDTLDPATIKGYTNHLLTLESDPLFAVPVSMFGDPEEGPRRMREYLSRWLNNPRTYNYRLTSSSALFNFLIDKGLIQRNPCRDIQNRTVAKRKVYVEDQHYIQIMKKLDENFHEVYARCCDWMYLVSGRVSNMLAIEEQNITTTHVKYFATKNRRLGAMEIDPDIQFLIDWFRQFKRDQGIISKYLVVHPLYKDPKARKGKVRRAIAGQNITVENLYRRFVKAKKAAGLGHLPYTLKDLRPKALTDEAENRGEKSNKGMHSEAMQQEYVKKRVPERLDNTLTLIKWK